jgi:hypothetical protein
MRCSNKTTHRLRGLVAVLLASALAAGAAAAGNGRRQPQPVGSLSRVLQNSVYLRGRLASDHDTLHAGDTVRTDRDGRAKVQLLLKQTVCNLFNHTQLIVRPRGDIGLQLTYGKVWCGMHRVSKRERITGPRGLQISAKDPVVGLTVSRRRTVVMVWQGLVTVSGTGGAADAVLVGTHQQTTVPRGGNPDQPTAAQVTRQDRAVAGQLQASIGRPADTVVPRTTLIDQPKANTNATSAIFTFAAKENGIAFACRLDSGGFHPCTSPVTLPDLGEGEHVFAVRGLDPAGNVGPAETYTWTVDTTPPNTTIVSHPDIESNARAASFVFKADEANVSFTCELDKLPPTPCSSPQQYVLKDGSHTFGVQATDLAGNLGPPATFGWLVDTVPPHLTITSGPGSSTASNSATFAFNSDDTTAPLECQLDAAGFQPCTSPTSYRGMPPGQHVFEVRATDAAGNIGNASYSWTIYLIG